MISIGYENFKPVDDSITRVCKVCKLEKKLNLEFYYHSATNCYPNCCKECYNLKRRLLRKKETLPEEFNYNKKRIKKKAIFENKPYRKTSYYNRKRLDYKAVDKKKGLDSNLTTEFIENCFSSSCVYCGYPANTLDRKDNNIGHTIDNCVPACYECNTARNRLFSYEEMIILGKSIKEIKDNRIAYNLHEKIFPRSKKV